MGIVNNRSTIRIVQSDSLDLTLIRVTESEQFQQTQPRKETDYALAFDQVEGKSASSRK